MIIHIVTQIKPFEFVNLDTCEHFTVTYEMLMLSKPNKDGIYKMVGTNLGPLDEPLYFKAEDVSIYLDGGNGD